MTTRSPAVSAQAGLLRRSGSLLERLSLRARLTIIAALAVAIAVGGIASVAYIAVFKQLRGQADSSVQSQLEQFIRSRGHFMAPTQLASEPGAVVQEFFVDYVFANGSQSLATTQSQPLADPAAFAPLAAAPQGQQMTIDSHLRNGTHVRAAAQAIMVSQDAGLSFQPAAVVVARTASDDDATLEHLRLLLLIAGGIGVLVAAAGGLVVARSGLRPVDRLTEAAEHIARTEDLDVPLAVTGSDEIARLARAFNSMTSALSSSRERQKQLVADAGHELRTPLTSMRTNLDLLIRSERSGRVLPADDREKLLEDLSAQMAELGTLIGELVNLARDDRAIEPTMTVDLAGVVERAVERVRLRTEGDISVALATWPVLGRPAELERAVVNLLDNAVKFSPAGETVAVELQSGLLSIADRGPGLSEEDRQHAFERFWRATSSRGMPGSGLGLSIVAQTLESHGGSVSLDPRPGGGTVARVSLPPCPAENLPAALEVPSEDAWRRPADATF